MTDPDCWPDHFPDSLYSYPNEVFSYHNEESWLIAQVALARLHFEIPNEYGGAKEVLKLKSYLVLDVDRLFDLAQANHWISRKTTPEEATALISAPCQ